MDNSKNSMLLTFLRLPHAKAAPRSRKRAHKHLRTLARLGSRPPPPLARSLAFARASPRAHARRRLLCAPAFCARTWHHHSHRSSFSHLRSQRRSHCLSQSMAGAFARVRRHHVYVALASFFWLGVCLCWSSHCFWVFVGLRVARFTVTGVVVGWNNGLLVLIFRNRGCEVRFNGGPRRKQ